MAGLGNALLINTVDTHATRVTAQYSEKPTFGCSWVPVKESAGIYGKALTAWWNSTPARIALLNRPSGSKMTYPNWYLDLLKEVPAPERTNNVQGTLAEAYEAIVDHPLERMDSENDCKAREIIDNAATEIMRLPPETVNRWRMLLRNEPRINNRLADIKAMP